MFTYLTTLPEFIYIFLTIFFAIFIFIIAYVWVKFDNTVNYNLPDPDKYDWVSIATLRGGKSLLIKTMLAEFIRKDLVEISGAGKQTEVSLKPGQSESFSHPLEEEFFKFLHLRSKFKLKDLFANFDKNDSAKTIMDKMYRSLIADNLLKTNICGIQAAIFASLSLFILFVFNMLTTSKSFVSCVFILIALLFCFKLTRPVRKYRQSALGRKFIKQLRIHFEWLKTADKSKLPKYENFAIALFGIGVLASLDPLNPLLPVFYKNPNNAGCDSDSDFDLDDGGCSGCGGCGGCGGCSSGDGGGGGGGCGGGCGGD